jgi:hypothetical protein
MDRLGVFASSACAAHCALGPVLANGASTAHLFCDERFELVLVVIACLLAMLALRHGWSRHRSLRPILFGATGLAIFGAVRAIEIEHHVAELIGSIAASAMLVTGHVLNLGALKRCETDCCVDGATSTTAGT